MVWLRFPGIDFFVFLCEFYVFFVFSVVDIVVILAFQIIFMLPL